MSFTISGFVINTGVCNFKPFPNIKSLSIFNIGVPALTCCPGSVNLSNPSPSRETVSIPT